MKELPRRRALVGLLCALLTILALLFFVIPLGGSGTPLSFDFMLPAFVTGTVTAVVSGPVGFFVVSRRQVFAGEALSHVAFTSALGATLLGTAPALGMLVISTAVAAGMALTAMDNRSHDVTTGIVLAWVLGVGALFLYIYASRGGGDGSVGLRLLFGDLLGVNGQQAMVSMLAAVASLMVLAVIGRPLLLATIEPALAALRGVPVRALSVIFLGLVAVTITMSIQTVGALLVLTLLVLPAATARSWTANPFRAMILASFLAIAFVWSGLLLGFYLPHPISFFVTTIAFGAYLVSRAALLVSKRSTWPQRAMSIGSQPHGYV